MNRRKFLEVKRNLVLTDHGKDNYYGNRDDGLDRTCITINQIAETIAYGIYGFCGNGRFKKTYRNIECIYKYNKGEYVVITYYRKSKNSRQKRLYKLFDQIKSS